MTHFLIWNENPLFSQFPTHKLYTDIEIFTIYTREASLSLEFLDNEEKQKPAREGKTANLSNETDSSDSEKYSAHNSGKNISFFRI